MVREDVPAAAGEVRHRRRSLYLQLVAEVGADLVGGDSGLAHGVGIVDDVGEK